MVKRRTFLASAAAGIASAYPRSTNRNLLTPLTAVGAMVSLADFGGDPTGIRDSAQALTEAVQTLKKAGAGTLVFPKGTYRLTPSGPSAANFEHLSTLHLQGNESRLLIAKDARALSVAGCSNVIVEGLAIDYDPLPFTQGVVTESAPLWFRLHVDTGFPVLAGDISHFASYDRSLVNFTGKPLESSGSVAAVEKAGTGDLIVHFKQPIAIPDRAVIVMQYKQGHNAVSILHSQDVSFINVRLHSSYSVGFSISQSANLQFRNCLIGLPARSSRLLSTNADGMHITDCSGTLDFDRCIFQAMGDDALNITTGMWRLQPYSKTGQPMLLRHSGNPVRSAEGVKTGDQLVMLDPKDMHIVAHGRTADTGQDRFTAQVEGGSNSSLESAIVVDTDLGPTTHINNCQFKGNRARALVAHKNLTIRMCEFHNTTGPAILLAPDSIWMEGPLTENIIIDSSHFANCHYASRDPEGTITIDVMHTYSWRGPIAKSEARNVQITNNVFESCPTAAISCRSVDQITIDGNHIGQTWTLGSPSPDAQAIMATQLTNSSITGNTTSVPNVITVRESNDVTIRNNMGFIVHTK